MGFKCPKCDKKLSNKSNLTKHLRLKKCDKKQKVDKLFKCQNCLKKFLTKSNLVRHANNNCFDLNGSIKNRIYETILKDDESIKIIEALPSMGMKFTAAQKMGIYVPDLYPLVFVENEKGLDMKEKLPILPFHKSEEILISILKERECINLSKQLTIIHDNSKFDLNELTLPSENVFTIEHFGKFVKVSLKPDYQKRRMDKLAQEIFEPQQKKIKSNEPITAANDAREVVNNDQFYNNDNEENLDEQGQPPDNPIDPPAEGEPQGGQGGDPGDDDPDDEDDNAGGGGAGGPIPPNNNENDENLNPPPIEIYLQQIQQLREPEGRGRGRSTPKYRGRALLHFENLGNYDAYMALYQAAKSIHQYISLHHFPKILTRKELQTLTGHSQENFQYHVEFLSPPPQRFRILAKDAKALLYLQRMKQGTKINKLGVERNVSGPDCHDVFWEHAMFQYYNDDIIPHRNIQPQFELPTVDDILQANVVEDEYLLGVFSDLLQPGQSLVIWLLDHTYLYMPSVSSVRAQKRTRCEYKKKNLVKYGVLTNYLGQPVRYTPPSASISPGCGDANLQTLQLHYETENEVHNSFNELMRPQKRNFVVVTFVDRGYLKHRRREGDRGTTKTMFDLWNNPNSQGYDPNARLLYPLEAKDQILDNNFRPQENPNLRNRDDKLTCREAGDTRLSTKIRWAVEACFMAARQYRLLDQRFLDEKFFDPCGDRLPENPNLPKVEILFNNVLSMQKRNHLPFDKIWPLPSEMNWHQMGRNFEARRKLHNEFETLENITYEVKFDRFPPQNSRTWNVVQYTDPILLFSEIDIADFTMVTHGPFQINNGRKYLTNINEVKVREMVQNDPNITWQQYDLLCATLPNDYKVAFYDHFNQPRNWNNELFGPWCPRRILFATVPNRISGAQTDHKVLIAYLPNSPEWDQPDFVNRLGFIQNGLKNILGYACIAKDCRVGYRLNGCCSHVATVLLAVGVFSHQLF